MDQFDNELAELFAEYRAACPELEPSAHFMPKLWRKIEGRRSFASQFTRFAQAFVTASAAICVLMAGFLVLPSWNAPIYHATYLDALAADQAPDKMVYAEIPRLENFPVDSHGDINPQ